jgi:hypothetical protein
MYRTRAGTSFGLAMADNPDDPAASQELLSQADNEGNASDIPAGNAPDAPIVPAVRERQFRAKDVIKLCEFRGVTDLHTVEDFLFQLDLFFDAQSAAFDPEQCADALRHQLLTIVGCFPIGSVAAVWFRSLHSRGKFISYAEFRRLFVEQFRHEAIDLVTLQTRWEDASQRRTQKSL